MYTTESKQKFKYLTIIKKKYLSVIENKQVVFHTENKQSHIYGGMNKQRNMEYKQKVFRT